MSIESSIASSATALSQAKVMQQYSVSLAKKAMDSTEQLALGELAMLPDQAQTHIPKGQYIDVLV